MPIVDGSMICIASGRAGPSGRGLPVREWLPDRELAGSLSEYGRTGFQGGLQSYRVERDARLAGRTIDVPALVVSGESDWECSSAPAATRRCRRPRARNSSPRTCSMAPATGSSRSSRPASPRSSSTFCARIDRRSRRRTRCRSTVGQGARAGRRRQSPEVRRYARFSRGPCPRMIPIT